MKIVHIIPDLSYGGVQKICIDLCNYQVGSNEVYLFSLLPYNSEMIPLKILNRNVQLINFNKRKGFDYKLIRDIYKALKELRPDIINAHIAGLFYAISYVIVRPKTKFFYIVHGLVDKYASFHYKIFYWPLFKFFRVRPIAISIEVLRNIQKIYGKKYNDVIYNGVDIPCSVRTDHGIAEEIKLYKHSNSTRIFLNVARIAKEKNQQLLIHSFNQLVLEKYDASLLIIGDIEGNLLFEELKKIAGPHIYFLGKRDNISDYLEQVDAFCLTSHYEGLSLAIIEAMSMQLIPICTPVGGIPEVILDGYNGILSDDCTMEAYLRALKRYLTMNEQNKMEMCENAFRVFKEHFTIERCGEEYLRLYKS